MRKAVLVLAFAILISACFHFPPTVPSSPSPNVWVGATPTSTPTAEPRPNPEILSSAGPRGPLRPHHITSIGTGIFAQVTYSDGLAAYTNEDVRSQFGQVQVSRFPVGREGCWISGYDADNVWFRSGAVGAVTITVGTGTNGLDSTGVLNEPTGPHGYILELDHPLQEGEWVCITVANGDGFYITYGPDLYPSYDSYCSRESCN